jgi:nucleoid DNA-binding protein
LRNKDERKETVKIPAKKLPRFRLAKNTRKKVKEEETKGKNRS